MAEEPLEGFRAFLAWFGSGYRTRSRPAAERILAGSAGFCICIGVLLGVGIATARLPRYAGDFLLGFAWLFELFAFGVAGLALGSLAGALLGAHLVGGRDALRRTCLWMLGGAVACGLLGLVPVLLDPAMAKDVPAWVFLLAGGFAGMIFGAYLGSRREAARRTGG